MTWKIFLLKKKINYYVVWKSKYSASNNQICGAFPNKVKWPENKIAKASEAALLREEARSEFTGIFWVIRAFALKAGALTGELLSTVGRASCNIQ